MRLGEREVRERVARVDGRLAQLEALGDSPAGRLAAEAVAALLELYGEGLARIVDQVDRLGGPALRDAIAGDELVAHLLLLHGVHPVDLETRVRGALASVRPYLEAHGGDVELVGLADGMVRLRLRGSCRGCPSSALTLKLAIEAALQKAAPDLRGIEAEGIAEPAVAPAIECPAGVQGFIPVATLLDGA